MTRLFNSGIAPKTQSTLPNNAAVCALQLSTIGRLERALSAGDISYEEYQRHYVYYASLIRSMSISVQE